MWLIDSDPWDEMPPSSNVPGKDAAIDFARKQWPDLWKENAQTQENLERPEDASANSISPIESDRRSEPGGKETAAIQAMRKKLEEMAAERGMQDGPGRNLQLNVDRGPDLCTLIIYAATYEELFDRGESEITKDIGQDVSPIGNERPEEEDQGAFRGETGSDREEEKDNGTEPYDPRDDLEIDGDSDDN